MHNNLILVTGATGFVGQSLCAQLMAEGCKVRCSVRNQTSNENSITVGDIDPATQWERALTGVKVVIHLAARVHIMTDSSSDPLAEFRRVNVGGTLNLARQAAAAGINRFIFLSSIKVNGEQTRPGVAFSETSLVCLEDAYALSKHEAELGLQKISQETGMEVVVIRPPLVYGPGVKGNFYSLIKLVEKGIPLPLGAIHNRRSLIGLDNLVDFIITCIDHPAAANETFLVADGQDLSTTDLLKRLATAMNKPSRLIPVPETVLKLGFSLIGKKAMAQRLCGNLQVDISKAREVLGWEPPVSVDDALKKAVCER